MRDEPGQGDAVVPAGQRALLAQLRAVVEAKDAENAALRAELDAERELRRRLELRLAELERRLSMDSTDSGTPSSKERIGAKQARRARQQSERGRRKDRKRGGQPGHQGKGLERDPDPDEQQTADPPAECRSCKAALDGADAVGPRWAQVIDAEIIRTVTEWALPVPLEYSIEWLTCAFASTLGEVMVGLAGAAQDHVLAYVPGARLGRPGVPR